jgi:hypothetical protein
MLQGNPLLVPRTSLQAVACSAKVNQPPTCSAQLSPRTQTPQAICLVETTTPSSHPLEDCLVADKIKPRPSLGACLANNNLLRPLEVDFLEFRINLPTQLVAECLFRTRQILAEAFSVNRSLQRVPILEVVSSVKHSQVQELVRVEDSSVKISNLRTLVRLFGSHLLV